jgi:outer membrane protein TolC
VSLAEWLGRTGERVEADGARLLASSPAAAEGGPQGAKPNPFEEIGRADRDTSQARRELAESAFRPRVDLLASFYGRGTGALLDGSFEGGTAGLWPERANWALGVALRFPLLDFIARQETKVEDHREQAATARWEQTVQHVEAELERARIHLDSARRIAENTPAELEAARALQVQAQARYDAGLAEVLDVAEAERILRRAETEDALARLDVWRARFEVAAAEGDLAPVISELEEP